MLDLDSYWGASQSLDLRTEPVHRPSQKPIKPDAPVVKPVAPLEKIPALPLTSAGWFTKGVQHLDDRDRQEAVDAFTKAIKLKVSYAEAYERRAVAHFAGMGQSEALADINKALTLDPTNADFYLTRSGFHCFRWEAGQAAIDLNLAKSDESKAVQFGGTLSRACGAQVN